jgi:hypothetical protein
VAKYEAAIRQRHLDPDDVGRAPPESRPWWQQRCEWPPGVHFEDVSAAELALERLTDGGMPPRPIPAGAYGCTAAMCEMSRFAEPEIEGVSG